MSEIITIATCQHPVTGDVKSNLKMILKLMRQAKGHNPDIVHFSECNLSGYPGIDFNDYSQQQEEDIKAALHTIREKAAEYQLRLIIGSHYSDPGLARPFNSLYLLDQEGKIENRYDKRFLAGAEGQMDKKYYSPGENPLVFRIKNTLCGLLICHEWRYPELYREYQRMGVKVLFQSWYDGSLSAGDYFSEGKELGNLITGTVKGNAANNSLWISGSNTSKKESCFGSFFVQPDGKILHKLYRNKSGILISKIDTEQKFEDPSFFGRIKINQNMDGYGEY